MTQEIWGLVNLSETKKPLVGCLVEARAEAVVDARAPMARAAQTNARNVLHDIVDLRWLRRDPFTSAAPWSPRFRAKFFDCLAFTPRTQPVHCSYTAQPRAKDRPP
jgi:hypothetical protein